MFDDVKLMFTALELVFVGVKLVSDAVEHKLLRSKNTFYFRFQKTNQPKFNKNHLSFRLKPVLSKKMFTYFSFYLLIRCDGYRDLGACPHGYV